MSGYHKTTTTNITRHNKKQKTNKRFEETEQTSEPQKARMLELGNQEFKTSTINMLRALVDKVDSMQEQTGNVSQRWKSSARTKKKF